MLSLLLAFHHFNLFRSIFSCVSDVPPFLGENYNYLDQE